MAYLGAQPNKTLTKTTSQSFNGTGSATTFTLNRAVNTEEELEVFVENVQQEPGSGKSYTASGTTLTFDEAPPSGTGNIYVIYRGQAEVTTRLEHDANQALSATTGTFSGAVALNGGANFGDSDKAQFGAGNDLQIYHDGSNSYIIDGGTGDLVINTNGNAISLNPNGGGEYGARVINNGAVELYHDNSKKLETTSSGITVTGYVVPTLIAFEATLSANQTGFDTTSFGDVVEFDQTSYNNGNAFKTSGSDIGLFVAPVAGIYTFDYWIYSSVDHWSQAWLVLGGARMGSTDVVQTTSGAFIGGSATIKLSAGQKIGVHPYNAGSSEQINANVNHTYFRGHLVTAI